MAHRHRYAARVNSFIGGSRTPAAIEHALRRIAGVPGIGAIEANFGQHLGGANDEALFALCERLLLPVTALNIRFDGPQYALGALTNPEESARDEAIAFCDAAILLARAREIPHIVVWLGPDGFETPFQVDHTRQWDLLVAGMKRIAARAAGIKISIEYKPSEPRRRSSVGTMAETLLLVGQIQDSNLGVTLDFCHALMAGESPAKSAALALREHRLFGVHLNDGYGPADDGLPVASVHLFDTLELLWQLRTHAYEGTIYFDTFPTGVDPGEELAANIAMVERLEQVLDRLDASALAAAQARNDQIGAQSVINRALLDAGS